MHASGFGTERVGSTPDSSFRNPNLPPGSAYRHPRFSDLLNLSPMLHSDIVQLSRQSRKFRFSFFGG